MATATSETMVTDADAESFAALKVNEDGVEAVRLLFVCLFEKTLCRRRRRRRGHCERRRYCCIGGLSNPSTHDYVVTYCLHYYRCRIVR